ncbi:MAG TPA: Uma2 family endonuclease [Polyangia bacterium]|nr:Uma2 family endonuclease [Polyangia bacterium]
MSSLGWLADLAPERVRPLKRVEYERLVSEGAFDDERVELLDGVIIEMSPQDPGHSGTVARLAELLTRVVSADKQVRAHAPLAVSSESLLEPDVAVVPRSDREEVHPGVAFLLVEVSNSSLRKDRSLKSRAYALAGVPEYWIVNLVERQVEVRTRPIGGAYSVERVARLGETISVEPLGGLTIAVDDFLR